MEVINRMNFSYKVIKNGRVVGNVRIHSKRLFLRRLRSINWGSGAPSVYLRVSYGKRVNNFGRLITFYNDGIYKNNEDLWGAFNAFIEE